MNQASLDMDLSQTPPMSLQDVAIALRDNKLPIGYALREGNPLCLPDALLDWYIHRLLWWGSSKMLLGLVGTGFDVLTPRSFLTDSPKPFTKLMDDRLWLSGRPLADPDDGACWLLSYRPPPEGVTAGTNIALCLWRKEAHYKNKMGWVPYAKNSFHIITSGTRPRHLPCRLADLCWAWATCGERTPQLYVDGRLKEVLGRDVEL